MKNIIKIGLAVIIMIIGGNVEAEKSQIKAKLWVENVMNQMRTNTEEVEKEYKGKLCKMSIKIENDGYIKNIKFVECWSKKKEKKELIGIAMEEPYKKTWNGKTIKLNITY